LTKKGYISKDNKARGIELLPHIKEKLFTTDKETKLPLYGQIPAGNPTTTLGNQIDQFSISDYLIKNANDCFLLEVRGDSVDKSGILDGDLVIVSKEKEPRNFDIVVALVDEENTLKQYTRHLNGSFHLEPYSTNPAHQEIIPINEAYIQGVVIGSIRKY
jgi:repressor LexA